MLSLGPACPKGTASSWGPLPPESLPLFIQILVNQHPRPPQGPFLTTMSHVTPPCLYPALSVGHLSCYICVSISPTGIPAPRGQECSVWPTAIAPELGQCWAHAGHTVSAQPVFVEGRKEGGREDGQKALSLQLRAICCLLFLERSLLRGQP